MGNQSPVCCETFQSQKLHQVSNPLKYKQQFHQSPFYEVVYPQTKIIYRGQLKSGVPHGKGMEIHPNGDIYEGQFENGVKQGLGTYCFSDGSKFQGNFAKNLIEGKGVMIFTNGDVYEGEFRRNQIEGFGIYKCKSQDSQYRGYYLKGVKHGEGQILFNGMVHKGVWQNGVFKLV